MNTKRLARALVLSALLCVFLTFPASASMVSFLVVETGLNDEMPSAQYSSLWEGGLMETFFNAGHIVTNSPISRMEKRPAQDLSGMVKADFDEAALGGADYFILGFLSYQMRGTAAIPSEITIKLYRADTRELVFERIFPAGKGKNLDEEYQLAQNAGRLIASHIKER